MHLSAKQRFPNGNYVPLCLRNLWKEVTGGIGTLFEIFNAVGKGKCNDEMSDSTLARVT